MERNYREVLDDALKDIKQELVIVIDNDYYLVYIHNISFNNNEVYIDWSTPHEESEISRDLLFNHVSNAIKVQLMENTKNTELTKPNIFTKTKTWFINLCIKLNQFIL